MDKLRGLNQAVVGSRIQPGKTTAQQFNLQVTPIQIHLVQRGNLKLPARGGFNFLRHCHHIGVIKIESGHRPVRFRLQRLLFNRQRFKVLIKLHHTETFRIENLVAEYRSSGCFAGRRIQFPAKALTKIDVIAQD